MLKINGKVGELAGPASVEPAVILADTSRYYVRAFVEELDAPRVEVGMPAKITVDALRDQALPGRVVRLSPRMDRKSRVERPINRTIRHENTRNVDRAPARPSIRSLDMRVDVTIDLKVPPKP